MFFSQEAFGATRTWDRGANTDNWGDGNNWNPNGAPGAGDDVVIDINAAILVNVSPTINSLTINNSAVVSLTSSGGGRTITIDNNTGSSVASGSSLTLRGSTGSGIVSMTLEFSGTVGTMDIAGNFILTAVGEGTIYNATNSITTVTGTFSNDGSGGGTAGVITSNSSNLFFSAGGTYIHSLNGGTIPTATWNSASNCNITGVTGTVPAGLTQAFGNFTWNCTGQTGTIALANNLTTVNGNLSILNTNTRRLDFFTNGTVLNIYGDFIYGNGATAVSSRISTSTGTPTNTINLYGDFTLAANASITTRSNSNILNFNFRKSGTQVYTGGGSFSASVYNFTIYSGATLDMGTSILNGSSGTFTLASGAGLMTAHAQGISTTAGTGSIQMTGAKTYNSGANYTYYGTVNQVTGNGLPTVLTGNLTINNTGTSGNNTVTLSSPTSVSGIFTLANGKLITTTNLLSVTNTSSSAIVGGSSTAYIDGPLRRTLPANLLSGSTYSFPVGSGATYLPFSLINPTTNTTGTATAQVQAIVGTSGGTANVDASLISKSNSEYWLLAKTGSFTNSSVSLARPASISPLDVVGGSSTLAGTYSSLGGTEGTYGVSGSNLIGSNQYFALAQAASTITTGSITGSSFCAGASVSVPFTKTGVFVSGNVFTAQLSNSAGSFASPVNIGSITSTTSGTISATIPANTSSGSGYRIRVVSNTPVKTGTDNGANLTINAIASVPTTTGANICIGGNTGVTLSASGAVAGQNYKWYNAASAGILLKTSTNNTDNTYTTAVISSTTNYWVSIVNAGGCESARSIVTATFPTVSADNQNAAGTNSWIGHVYDGTTFDTYYGSYVESESFNQNFGGDATCFNITSNSISRSINTEQFSVKYRMNSTKKGLYVVDLGSDDGGRLTVDGTLLYNNWSDQAFSTKARVLMNLNGASSLVYEFYENGGGNQVVFQNLTQILSNTLSTNTSQSIILGNSGASISGNAYGSLPAGITLSGTGYQWTYSTTPSGIRTNIAGATGATYTPNTSAAPFNVAGTYYIFRNAVLSSANNVNPNPYVATSESNACTLNVTAPLQFRSITSGNWNLTSTWESSSDNGVTWVGATITPNSSEGLVTVQATHIVTLTSAQTAKNININGTLDLGTNTLTGPGTFTLASGAGLITAHAQGISTTAGTGSIQMTGAKAYNSGANYTYNGTVNQVTGNGLPTVLTGNLTINNTGTLGNNSVTLSAATSVSGILTLANGKLITTTNLLSVTNEAPSAIVGGSSTAYIDGPLKRTLPESLGSGSTYNYPIGSGVKYLPFSLVNPTTTATSSPTVQVRAYTNSTGGTVDATLDSISTTEYWMLTPTANVTNTSVSMARTTAISPLDVIAGKTLSNGTNIPYGGTVGVNGITNSNTVAIGNIDARYFVFGKRKPGIFSTVTALSNFTYKENLGPSTIQSFTVSGYSLTTNLKLEMLRGNYELSTSNAPSFVGSGVLYLPVANGVVSPTTIYIRLKAGLAEKALITDSVSISSSGYTSKIVNCSGSVTTPAKLTTSPATLTMSNYTFGGGPSVAQSFVFSGTLLNGSVTVTPPAGFEIATSAGGAYQSTAFTYTPSSGTLGNTTLWARMKSGLGVGTHTGNIVVASSGAVSKNIECSGTVNLGATLTNSTSFLGAFSYNYGSGPSDPQSFVITGQNLTGNIVVTPTSTNFAISRTRGGTYQTSALTITASGSFSDSIFVKMIGGLNVGSYGPFSITVASNGAVTKSVACSGQVFAVATAAIKTSTSSVSGFGYKYAATNPIGVESGGPSNPQSFVVTGVSLSSDIVVQAPDSFEVSTSINGSYFNSLTLVRTGSKVTPKTVYVRLKKSLPVGIYSGSINLTSGMSTSTTVLCNAGKVYASPLITVTGEGDYCLGSTINLGSSGEDIQNRYWEGPNDYYTVLHNPTLTTNATSALSGDYTVTGNVVVGGNLIYNGSFELGNVGFGSAYGYPQTPFTQTGTNTSLQSEGKYAITTTGSVVHNNFNNVADKNIDGTKQMVVNGNTTAGAVVWSQNVAVLPNADYEFSYWLQTVVNGVDDAPSKLQLYVNGVAAGPVYTANPNSGIWTQYVYNTNSNSNSILNLELINQTTVAGGNDFALDSLTFRQVLIAKETVAIAVGSALPVSVSLVASQNPVNAGSPVTYTATPVNGGTAPIYEWFVNNSPVSAASGSTYTYFPSSGDLIKCVLVSSLSCVTNNPATSNTVTQVVNVVANPNYWYGKISTDWGVAANWTANRIPAAGEDVEYATINNTDSIAVRDLYVDTDRTIGSLINATTRRLVIPAGKSLSVNNSITTNNDVNTIYIQSSPTLPTGTLTFNNAQNYPVHATVEMYSSASWDLTRPVNQKYNWQFFGIPLRSVVAVPTLTGSYVRRYLETGTTISNHWQQLLDESVLSPFYTYEICQKEPKIYTFKGQLVNSNFNSGQLAKTVGAIYPGQHMFANPYTAGMDIRQIQFGSDMDSTVYMYHTGSFGSWSSAAAGKVGENAGQYVSVPQNKAGTSTIPRQVPSMGSMLIRLKPTVSTSTANCYVNFNYASLVMKNTDLLRAPSTKNDIQSVAVNTRIDVTGNNTQDKMWIFSDDSCSRGFDNGDDGIKILGTALQPQIYAVEADGNYQINAVNDMNNTTIAFQAGEDTEYTLTFNHEFAETKYEKIYLHDLVENTILNITENGSIYKFTATSTPNAVNRFRIITKSIGEESTTQSNVKLFVAEQSIYVQNFSDFDGTVYLYDVTGRLHGTTRISPNGVVFFPAKAYNAYVVKTVLLNETVTQKIVLK